MSVHALKVELLRDQARAQFYLSRSSEVARAVSTQSKCKDLCDVIFATYLSMDPLQDYGTYSDQAAALARLHCALIDTILVKLRCLLTSNSSDMSQAIDML